MYRPSGIKILLSTCNLLAILAITGCNTQQAIADSPSASQPIAETKAVQQLIIKFKPDSISCDTSGIAQLSSAIGVRLEFIRPMSGDACVIRQLVVDAKDLLRNQERLRQHPAVEWLEQDVKRKPL